MDRRYEVKITQYAEQSMREIAKYIAFDLGQKKHFGKNPGVTVLTERAASAQRGRPCAFLTRE